MGMSADTDWNEKNNAQQYLYEGSPSFGKQSSKGI